MDYIKDEDFIRGKVPMTKEEIRILSIAKLRINENSRVLDIGAGTGSVSVQIAKMTGCGEVVAIEKQRDAVELINKNKQKFSADNLYIVEGEAVSVLDTIEGDFDGIFVGGSGGNIEDIITNYDKKLKKDACIVLNFITIDNLYKTVSELRRIGYCVECTEVSISKSNGNTYMMTALNSVYIVQGIKPNGNAETPEEGKA